MPDPGLRRFQSRARPLSAKRRGETGLSMIEVIVVMMISSLILAAVLPLSLRAVSANHRLGSGMINLSDRDIAEAVFRDLFASAAPLRFGDDRAPSTLEGDAERARISLRRGRVALCGDGPYDALELRIVEAGTGGLLICEAKGQQRTLYDWRSGEARFAYSLDGKAWSSAWPPRGSGDEPALRSGSNEIERLRRNVVASPLIRFEVLDRTGKRRVSWIAQSGYTEPLVFNPSADIEWEGPAAFENLQ